MKSAFLHAAALCAGPALAQSYAAGDRALPDLPVVASTSVPQMYFPFTVSPETALAANNDDFNRLASTWNTTLTVVNAGSSFQSLLSLSWPPADGPGANTTAGWGICAVAMPGLFSLLNITTPTNRTCDEILADACWKSLLVTLGGDFEAALTNRDGSDTALAGNTTAVCEQLAKVDVPPFCFRGHEEEEGRSTPFQGMSLLYYNENMADGVGYSVLNPRNGRPFLVGTDEEKDDALKRAWPLVVVEYAGNETVMTTMTCPVVDTVRHEKGSTNTTEQVCQNNASITTRA